MLIRENATFDPQRQARAQVVDYYDHCWDDYRILWRTDHNASVHYGFFDPAAPPWSPWRAWREGLAAIAAVPVAAVAGLLSGREAANRWLGIAARGRAARHDAAQQRMTTECANAVGLRPGDLVLDAGCGVGGTDLWLAQRYGVRVHGVNIQPLHLSEAQRNVASHPAGERVRLSMQDFTQLAVADASVDVVWALESVCHAANKAAFAAEAYRALRAEGRLMVADFFLADAEIPPRYVEPIQTWAAGWALHNLARLSSFRSLLAASGFRSIRCRDIGRHVVPSSWRLYKASLVALPINAVLEVLGVRSAVAGGNVRASFHQYRTLRAGVWTYAIFTAHK